MSKIEIPQEILIHIQEIIKAFNEKRLISIKINNPELVINKKDLPNKKIIFQIKVEEDGKQ